MLYQSIGIYTYSAKTASGKCATTVIRFRESAEHELIELVIDSAQMKVDDSHWTVTSSNLSIAQCTKVLEGKKSSTNVYTML